MAEGPKDATATSPHSDDLSIMARGTGVALIGGLLGSVAGWIGQLVLARLLGPGGFGSYSIGLAIVGVAAQLSTLGLSSATIYFVARYAQEDTAKARDVLVQSVGASLFAGLMAGGLLFLFSPMVAKYFLHRPELAPMIRIFALSIGFSAGIQVAMAATTVSYKLGYRVYLDLFTNGAFLLLFVIFYSIGQRLPGAAIAFLLSTILGFAASVYSLLRLYPTFFATSKPSSLVLSELLTYSMPAFAASLFWAPRGWMDRLLIGYFRAPAEVGWYQAASQSVSPLYLAAFAVNSIAAPMTANLYNRGELIRLGETFRVSSKWMLYSTLVVFIAVVAGPGDVLRVFFGRGYENGVAPLLILSIGAIVDSADGTARSMLLLTGHQQVLVRIAGASLLVQIILDVALIPRFGIAGAAAAEVGVSILLSTWLLLTVRRVLGMSPYDRRYFKGLVATLLTGAGVYLIGTWGISTSAIRLMLRGSVAVALFGAFMLVAGLDSEDRLLLVTAWKRFAGDSDR
jgi:O-antigen/teichoic acid export membrane protein